MWHPPIQGSCVHIHMSSAARAVVLPKHEFVQVWAHGTTPFLLPTTSSTSSSSSSSSSSIQQFPSHLRAVSPALPLRTPLPHALTRWTNGKGKSCEPPAKGIRGLVGGTCRTSCEVACTGPELPSASNPETLLNTAKPSYIHHSARPAHI